MLRYVLVSFGEQVGIGNDADRGASTTCSGSRPTPEGADTGGGTERLRWHGTDGGAVSSDVRQLLQQAETKFAAAQKALQSGDLQGYAKAQAEARDLVQQAIAAAGKATPTPSPSASRRRPAPRARPRPRSTHRLTGLPAVARF